MSLHVKGVPEDICFIGFDDPFSYGCALQLIASMGEARVGFFFSQQVFSPFSEYCVLKAEQFLLLFRYQPLHLGYPDHAQILFAFPMFPLRVQPPAFDLVALPTIPQVLMPLARIHRFLQ